MVGHIPLLPLSSLTLIYRHSGLQPPSMADPLCLLLLNILGPPLIGRQTLGQSSDLSSPLALHLKNGDNKNTIYMAVVLLKWVTKSKVLGTVPNLQ